MKNEKVLVKRDNDAINAHKKKLDELLPKYQRLINMYHNLKLDNHSKSLPEIIKNAFSECREQVRRGLPAALKDTDAVETITLGGEKEFLGFLNDMRKSGDISYLKSFNLKKSGDVEINQESIEQFVNEHSIWLTDLKGKEVLDKVIEALNEFESYSQANYRGISLVNTAFDGGIQLNAKWRLCNRDKTGKLVLDLNTLAGFESTRKN